MTSRTKDGLVFFGAASILWLPSLGLVFALTMATVKIYHISGPIAAAAIPGILLWTILSCACLDRLSNKSGQNPS